MNDPDRASHGSPPREDYEWGPPWRTRRDWRRERWHRGQRGAPGCLFARLAAIFGMFVFLVAASVAAVAYVLARLMGGGGPTAIALLVLGLAAAVALLLMALVTAMRTFRRVALPLSEVMSAADAVAEGNFDVRVPVRGPGEFARLARSFNRMTEELARGEQQRRNLTADVAHELRTPLHIIQGNLEGILDGVYEPTSAHIEATLAEARALGRLVEDLRVLSLAEAGELPLVHEPVAVAELLADVATSFGGQAEAAGISLRLDVAEAYPVVVGDAGRLDQVIGNLVANSLRHTPAGGQVTLAAETGSESGPEAVRIVVRDTGEGIAPGDLPFVFDRFWRGDRARSRAGGAGSGLGLAIARQLVQLHGGQISVASEPGRGTTFTVELPANHGDELRP